MAITFYNTLTRRKERFKSIREGEVSLYTCGPTVYNYVHIGNLRTFLFEDILVRYFRFKGYKVKQVMNITDVDDKTIRSANALGIPLSDYTAKYKDAFFSDIKSLYVSEAYSYPCATDHIGDMVVLIQRLIEKGFAYKSVDGSVYFSISKFKEYGRLSSIKARELKVGASARVSSDEYSKDDINDFVLWKAYTSDDGDVFWDTPLGKGRPGWHIECSAMSMRYLGKSFDIHTGGVDNIFPHHENEIAQSECSTGEAFVNYWLHSEFLNLGGEKSSKSKGNVIYLKDLLSKGYSREAIRFSLIASHYRSKVNFGEELIKQAQGNISTINSFIGRCKQLSFKGKASAEVISLVDGFIKEKLVKFEGALDDDLNMPVALASIFELIRELNKFDLGLIDIRTVLSFFSAVNKVLGIPSISSSIEGESASIDEDIKRLIEERELKRQESDYKAADLIRDKLKERGIVIEDSPSGVIWHRTSS